MPGIVGATAMPDTNTYQRQVQQTLKTLETFNDSSLVGMTSLGVKGIKALKQEIAEIFPASNLPAFLLQGLLQLEDRVLSQERIEADLAVLFRGSKNIGVYSILAAPALVIHGYQKILSLAGKDVDAAFPHGLWQFYTEFGLRQDAARHCAEANGFYKTTPNASDIDAATSWVYAAMRTLLSYDDLLANEWHEHRIVRSLDEVFEGHARKEYGRRPSSKAKAEEYDRNVAERVAEMRQAYQVESLLAKWVHQRPYHGHPKEPLGDYPAYRRARFAAYLDKALQHLPADMRTELEEHHAACASKQLPSFQEQLTILITLRAQTYQEYREPLPLHRACVALLAGGQYYLIDVCDRDEHGNVLVFPSAAPADPSKTSNDPLPLLQKKDGSLQTSKKKAVQVGRNGEVYEGDTFLGWLQLPPIRVIKGKVQAILRQARATARAAKGDAKDDSPPVDILLAESPRQRHNQLRSHLNKTTQNALEELRRAPIIVNWDRHDGSRSLGSIRRTHRGCGDHALTLIPTDRSMVLDLSHINFDGVWGMALAEILTGFAIAHYPLVSEARAAKTDISEPPPLTSTPAFLNAVRESGRGSPAEVSVENRAINLQAMNRMRSRLPKIDLSLTVNDILVLARCIHAATYRHGRIARAALDKIAALEHGEQIRQQIEEHLEEQRAINPALLIPMDASASDPSMRIFPATFRNPMLELPHRLAHCDNLVKHLQRGSKSDVKRELEQERIELYRDLKTFGTLMQTLRQVTMRGESFSLAAMRLLAHLPRPLQHLVNSIPQKIDMLNEIIKGSEVFSNVGQVAKTSSLTRFYSSRDDGETKLLIWGIMSDAKGQLCVTLRDFRPHVESLVDANQEELARILAQDYLDTFAAETNTTVKRIQRIFSHKMEGKNKL